MLPEGRPPADIPQQILHGCHSGMIDVLLGFDHTPATCSHPERLLASVNARSHTWCAAFWLAERQRVADAMRKAGWGSWKR
jgi:hypothetical protein